MGSHACFRFQILDNNKGNQSLIYSHQRALTPFNARTNFFIYPYPHSWHKISYIVQLCFAMIWSKINIYLRFQLKLICLYEKPKQIWQTSGFAGFRFSQDGDVPDCRNRLLSDQWTVTEVVGRLWLWSKIESWWHDQNTFWPTNSFPSKLSEPENVVAVVSNRKLDQ